MRPIYLDNNATTPLDPRVLDAMLPYLREEHGNAASRNHVYGQRARAAVERAREQVARLLGASAAEIVWTSGATESDNLAIQGIARARRDRGRHVITSPVEHKAVIDVCRFLEREGFEATFLDVDATGRVAPEAVARAIRDDTVLVTLMHANNEIGTLNPIADIGRVCAERGVTFHTDATQAVGKVPIDVEAMGIDLLSLSAHKLHGPKGVGALYVRQKRPRVRCSPLVHGGGHEGGLRSGTLNVPGIVGLGAACEIARAEMVEESRRVAHLRDRLWHGLSSRLDGVARNGHPSECLPNTLNVRFDGVEGERLIFMLPDLAISSGSACTTSSLEPSTVLRALGLTDEQVYGSLRFSLGRFTTEEEIDRAVDAVCAAVERVRLMSAGTASPDLPDDLFDPDASRERRRRE
jgi:cysteine desulfurase